jgi:hypothetical protein
MTFQLAERTRIVMLMVPVGPESGFRDCTDRPRLLAKQAVGNAPSHGRTP